MKLILHASIVVIVFVLTSCSEGQNKASFQQSLPPKQQDTSTYALFFKDTSYQVSPEVVQNIYGVLNTIVDSINKRRVPQEKVQLSRYKFQIMGLKSENGQQVFWVNALCDTYYADWRNELLSTKDGGDCFFNAKVNVSTATYSELYINGEV